ncbi:hypothetical protein D0T84_09720 [Dysgonomonas sp. 521]|uniref:hypothetical protein n=1 Tax=Dysgonomonas sp. 521 TaxID=2302932 RepID=UPI0013D2C529|nr:hypothetical protein [Dysgonomonas sp. 521]NDV95197.1 hypothetical protein [Dysgonomonas sp. 521]
MKVKSYRFLYRIFSFLSDKTNGASLFVKYKLILGALLVGMAVVSCGTDEDEPEVTCYLVYNPEEEAKLNLGETEKSNIFVVEEDTFDENIIEEE